jgi:hypothetical protein
VLAHFFGGDQVSFAMTSGEPFAGITRKFASFSQAAQENADSRSMQASTSDRPAVTGSSSSSESRSGGVPLPTSSSPTGSDRWRSHQKQATTDGCASILFAGP